MNPSALPPIIKNFFVLLCSIYTYAKILNLQFVKKTYLSAILFSLITAPSILLVQTSRPIYTVLTVTLLVTLYSYIVFRQTIPITLCISILSIGISYILFTLAMLAISPIMYYLFSFTHTQQLSIVIIVLHFAGIFQCTFTVLLFRIKRFRNGIPDITNIFLGDASIFIGVLLILFSSSFFVNDDSNTILDLLLLSFILALGIIIWLWWKKSIHTDYIFQSHTRRIDMLEDTLREKEAELDRLSKIIHKDNKLLAALEHSTRELLSAAPSDTAERLLQELNRFSEERRDTLSAYEAKQLPFPETSLFSIDTMLRYLQQRAQKYAIDFQVHFDENISSITDVITEQDLCTLIADLGENAIIATKSAEIKNILLSIEKKDSKKYTLNFFDSGEPFPEEVLAHLGIKRYTTHAATGGSGIGLMTTSELAQKYQAEFHISSTELSPPYTKCISLTFPHSLREL